VVKPHDSLAKIAHLNHTSVAKLKAANSLNSDLLHIGQKLMIPNKSTLAAGTVATTTAPTAAASATIPSASVPVASTTVAAATTTAPALSHNLYTVVKGDTLTKIAHKFKTTPSALMTANNITDPAKLSIGKKLKIPAKEARSAKNTEPAGTEPVQGPIKVSTAKTAQLANVEQ